MKIRELRIGNWIFEAEQDDNKPFQIFSIYHEVKNDKVNGLPICLMRPIPLTEDILLKCGFVKGVDNVFFLKTNLFYIRIFEEIGHVLFSLDKYSNSLKVSDSTKHLHQLQNLYFCLCGNELEINL